MGYFFFYFLIVWECIGGNSFHTGFKEGKGCLDKPVIKWKYGEYFGGGIVVGDVDKDGKNEIICGQERSGGGENILHVFNSEDLSILWTYPIGGVSYFSPALGDVDNDNVLDVVAVGQKGTVCSLYVLNGKNGKLIWGWERVKSSPVIGDVDKDGKVEVIVGEDDTLRILSGESGEVEYSFDLRVWKTPALADVNNDDTVEIIAGDVDFKVYSLNPITGKINWSFETGLMVLCSPTIGDVNKDDTLEVIVYSTDDTLYALNGIRGEVVWSFPLEGTGIIYTHPCIGDVNQDDTVEVICFSDSIVYCLNGVRGEEIWRYRSRGDNILITSAVIGDVEGDGECEIIFGLHGGSDSVIALNGKDGSVLWKLTNLDAGDCFPIIEDIDQDGWLEVVFGGTGPLVVLDKECPQEVEEEKEKRIEKVEIVVEQRELTIRFMTEKEGKVEVKLYDIIGREVGVILSKMFPKGEYTVKYDTSELLSGVYFLKFISPTFSLSRKLILLK